MLKSAIRNACLLQALLSPLAQAHQFDEWNQEVQPFQIYGNAYYVGVKGLSAVLLTSPQGHILIDGALPESAQRIAASIRALGFKVEDVKLILNSHTHFDHAGGIAELQRMSGAVVAASPKGALALEQGMPGKDDPQYAYKHGFPPVSNVRRVRDGETLTVGPLAVTARFTPGHTPGGTSWTWSSCEADRCVGIVYADSINPISHDDFRFSHSKAYPTVLADFKRSFKALNSASCDILLTVHPDGNDMWEHLEKAGGKPHALLGDGGECKALVSDVQDALRERLAKERKQAAGKLAARP